MEAKLRTYVRQLLEFKTSSDLITAEVRMRVLTSNKNNPDAPTVPDIMTMIRVIKGVSIVRQTVPIKRLNQGRDILELEVKYMPEKAELRKVIEELGKELKAVEGVEIVKITKVGGRDIQRSSGEPFLF